METAEHLAVIPREAEALARAATEAGLDAPVPTCPGWTVQDLVVHMASGDRWARTIVERRSTERVDWSLPEPPPSGDALVPWYLDGVRALVEVLAAADPHTPVWTFGSPRTVAFWPRRRALETAVHRVDAEGAAGEPQGIDAALAVDGVDEYLDVFVRRWGTDVASGGETLHFHCTDVDGEWLVARDGGDLRVTRAHAKGDVAARGTASDLMLFLWGRVGADRLEVFGEATLLDRFRAAMKV